MKHSNAARIYRHPLELMLTDVHCSIGVGKADITGPVVEVEFAGYADLAQVGVSKPRNYSL